VAHGRLCPLFLVVCTVVPNTTLQRLALDIEYGYFLVSRPAERDTGSKNVLLFDIVAFEFFSSILSLEYFDKLSIC
jgi:hypothetical protein